MAADVNSGIQNRFSLANSCALDNHHTLHARTFLNYLNQVEFNSVCSQRHLFSNYERTLEKKHDTLQLMAISVSAITAMDVRQ